MKTTSKRSITVVAGSSLILATVWTASWWRSAAADGVAQSSPMYYRGMLEQSGTPVNSATNIELALWNDATSTTAANRVCQVTPPAATPVTDGHFAIALGDACTIIVNQEPDLWIEPIVAGASLGRTKVGAVPYAIEAARASAAAGTLATQIVPTGMIAMFAGACPATWTEYTAMRGRFPRGEPNGAVGSLGTGGSDDTPVIAHSHTVSIGTTSDGSHAHSQNVSANFGTCPGSGINRVDFDADGSGACPYAQGATTEAAGGHSHTVSGSTASNGVAGTGTNLPSFAEVIYCIKQ